MSMNDLETKGENEKELINIIRKAEDPAKAMAIAVDVMQRLLTGEDEQSIAASYGLVMAASGKFVNAYTENAC